MIKRDFPRRAGNVVDKKERRGKAGGMNDVSGYLTFISMENHRYVCE